MDPFLIWLESTAFSTWMRESPSMFAFPAILSCHTVGMGLVAGINTALALRILGVASRVPVEEMKRFMPVMWFGFWLNAISGVALLIAYPTKALTNPVFYLKLVLIALAMVLQRMISRRLFRDPLSASAHGVRLPPPPKPSARVAEARVAREGGQPDEAAVAVTPLLLRAGLAGRLKTLAAASIVCWAGAITAGRFLAYTYTRLMAIF
jgi:hypothetical protein